VSTAAVKMLAGDREAYGEVYREFRPRVVGLCRYLLGSPDEAQDASSDALLALALERGGPLLRGPAA
jgi:DNA-directed RNA polymerase specialized sigma24 family protein